LNKILYHAKLTAFYNMLCFLLWRDLCHLIDARFRLPELHVSNLIVFKMRRCMERYKNASDSNGVLDNKSGAHSRANPKWEFEKCIFTSQDGEPMNTFSPHMRDATSFAKSAPNFSRSKCYRMQLFFTFVALLWYLMRQ
jgi:hypothetical protein